MKPYPFGMSLCALGLLAASSGPAEAAWNNVFQVTCHHRSCRTQSAFVQPPVVAQAAPADPCCNPCPQPVCTTRYVQRCYYQPVTCYTTKTYYEPVTTYTTKYYYEPVTTYRYTCQCDPCTGCCQQVACPVTSYCLKAQCCPVQSWVQRCCQVPVTTYQRVSYWEPQTCCVNPCNPCSNGGAVGVAPAPFVGQAPPQVQEQQPPVQTNPPPIIKEQGGSGNGAAPGGPTDRYYGPNAPAAPGAFRHPLPKALVPVQPVAPAIKLERIAFAPDGHLDGQVVKLDRTPRAGARVMFVNAGRQAANQTVTANAAGRFQVNLASGAWLVYVAGQDGRPVFQSRIEVDGRPASPLTVTAP
jgi:hypothetical protein